jgi:tetratricopeptide (TPR) repeat protein
MINLKGLKMNPENPVLQAGLGRCYLDKNDIVNAEVQFRKCLEISDQNLDALLGMAVVSYLKQEISYANGYINQAQTIAPALSAGMNGIESLERAGYYFPQQEKEVLSKLFFQMR